MVGVVSKLVLAPPSGGGSGTGATFVTSDPDYNTAPAAGEELQYNTTTDTLWVWNADGGYWRGVAATEELSPPPSGYDAAVLADSPHNFWKLNGSLVDSGAAANNMTGSTPNSSGGPLTENDGYAAVSGGAALVSTNNETAPTNYTVEWWMKTTAGGTSGYVFNIGGGGPGRTKFYLSGGTLYGWDNFNTSYVPTTTWTHYAFTWDGTTWKLYVNGALQSSSGNTPAAAQTSTVNLGQQAGGGNGIDNTIHIGRVAMWQSALTGPQIAAHYAAA